MADNNAPRNDKIVLSPTEMKEATDLAEAVRQRITRHAALSVEEQGLYEFLAQKLTQGGNEGHLPLAQIVEMLTVYGLELTKPNGVRVQILHVPEDDVLHGADLTLVVTMRGERGEETTLMSLDVTFGTGEADGKMANAKWMIDDGRAGTVTVPRVDSMVPQCVVGVNGGVAKQLIRAWRAAEDKKLPDAVRAKPKEVLRAFQTILWHEIEVQLGAERAHAEALGKSDSAVRFQRAEASLAPLFTSARAEREQCSRNGDLFWLFNDPVYQKVRTESARYGQLVAKEPGRELAKKKTGKMLSRREDRKVALTERTEKVAVSVHTESRSSENSAGARPRTKGTLSLKPKAEDK